MLLRETTARVKRQCPCAGSDGDDPKPPDAAHGRLGVDDGVVITSGAHAAPPSRRQHLPRRRHRRIVRAASASRRPLCIATDDRTAGRASSGR